MLALALATAGGGRVFQMGINIDIAEAARKCNEVLEHKKGAYFFCNMHVLVNETNGPFNPKYEKSHLTPLSKSNELGK